MCMFDAFTGGCHFQGEVIYLYVDDWYYSKYQLLVFDLAENSASAC